MSTLMQCRYISFIEKWLEQFDMSQFLIVRLEDYDKDPVKYMQRVLDFLDLSQPSERKWASIVSDEHANVAHRKHHPMLNETKKLLNEFYRPYNQYLAKLTGNNDFLWEDEPYTIEAQGHLRRHRRDIAHQSNEIEVKGNLQNTGSNPTIADPFIIDPEKAKYRLRLSPNAKMSGDIVLEPKSFDIEGLEFPYTEENPPFNAWVNIAIPRNEVITNNEEGAFKLCVAAFGLDVAAVKYLLYDVGVSPNLIVQEDAGRTPLHCLGAIETMADSNSRSQIFALLKGRTVDFFLHI
jgi:Sulfotransferase domain